MNLTNVYLFSLSLGFVFTVVGAIAGHFGGGDGGAEADATPDGPDVAHEYGEGGHGDAEGTEGGGLHLPLLSPTVLSCYAACFGGSGLIYQYLFGVDRVWMHFPLAGATGLALGVGVAYTMWKLTTTFSAHRTAKESDAIGALAEVSVSIPEVGMGEVAYVAAGTRQNVTAKSADGRAYKQGTAVRILKMLDGTAYVTEAPLLQQVGSDTVNAGEPIPPKSMGVKH